MDEKEGKKFVDSLKKEDEKIKKYITEYIQTFNK